MNSQNKLGRGLDALFGETGKHRTGRIENLPIASLRANPGQPRRAFDDESLQELATSIKAQGIIQALLVRPLDDGNYQIVAGERRWRAAKLAGLNEVPVLIKSMDDHEVMSAALIENLQREDLNPMEEASALKELREMTGMTQDALAARIGKSRPTIANALRLLQLSPQAQEDVRNGRLSPGHARCLLSIENEEAAEELRTRAIEKNYTVRETEEIVASWKKNGNFPWKKKVAPIAQDSLAMNIQREICLALKCKAKVCGNEDRGKISISYKSSDELQKILNHLGIAIKTI